jgi:hypothetical protein
MFIKSAVFTQRNWKILLLQLVALLGVMYLLMKGVKVPVYDEPAREMDLGQYDETTVPFSISGNSDLTLNFTKTLEIMLKPKKQKLQEVQGKAILEKKKTIVDKDLLMSLSKKDLN